MKERARLRASRITHALAAVTAILQVASTASAQQAPPAPNPPPGVINLGDVGIDDIVMSETLPISGGQNIWFRFRLTEGITPKTWLNIDTSRSTINTEIGLYDRWSYLVADDDFSGGGTTLTNSTASALTYGGGSGGRLGEDGAGWFGSRIDTGWNQHVGESQLSGGWRPNLAPYEFFVVVVGYDADFSQIPNPNWQVSTNFTGSGTIRLRIRTGTVPDTQWTEHLHGLDGGYMPQIAQPVEGRSGPLTTILGAFHPGERDIYKIRICDPEAFRATATLTLSWGNTYRGTMFLFDSDGRGVSGINNTLTGTDTVLTAPAGTDLVAGDYFLAISTHCGGMPGWQHVPYDASGQALWDFSAAASWNQSIAPNGTGAANPMVYAGRQADCQTNSDYYFVRLALQGCCYLGTQTPPAFCQGDMNCDGVINNFDIDAFVLALTNHAAYRAMYPTCSACPP